MTVVVWDGKILAADRMACTGDGFFKTKKLFQISKDVYAAVTGTSAIARQQIAWLKKKANYPNMDKDNFSRLIVATRGVKFLQLYEDTEHYLEITQERIAFGSGSEFARAGLELGLNSIESVKLTNKLCISCGCGVNFVKLNK